MDTDTKRWIFDRVVWVLGLVAALLIVADAAASDHRATHATNDTWRTECGSCHVPYPPQLLPAASWRAIVSGLDRHFGSDASVDPDTRAVIGAFLEQNSGRDRTGTAGPPTLRITETRWFQREHSRIAPATAGGAKAGSRADCAACHRNAAGGDFGERTLQLPY